MIRGDVVAEHQQDAGAADGAGGGRTIVRKGGRRRNMLSGFQANTGAVPNTGSPPIPDPDRRRCT
jgi:hypothetical protein